MQKSINFKLTGVVKTILISFVIYSCQKEVMQLPQIETLPVSDITENDFLCAGNINSEDESQIIECGFCYDINPFPTVLNSKVVVEQKSGRFEFRISYKLPGTKYYIRSFAATKFGLVYGNQIGILTKPTFAVCVTSDVFGVTPWSAIASGYLSGNGGDIVSEVGFCISESSNPTVNDIKYIYSKTNSKEFKIRLNNLTPGRRYYLRAFAKNSKGYGYGNEVTINTLDNNGEPLKDIDGNIYRTVVIGRHTWMAENLRVKRYNDGSPIVLLSLEYDWINTNDGAYCYYNNSEEGVNTFGLLYNWYAANNIKKLCPQGWHLPNFDEWRAIKDTAVGTIQNSAFLKEAGTLEEGTGHWASPNTNAHDSFGFAALPGGLRSFNGIFGNRNYGGYWWSSTMYNENNVDLHTLSFSDIYFMSWGVSQRNGLSVRCIKDD